MSTEPGQDPQELKQFLCDAFWFAGAEQPFPAGRGLQTLARGAVKVNSKMFVEVLKACGFTEVYTGRYGMKQLLFGNPLDALRQVPHLPDKHTAMDLGLMARDAGFIWLFGVHPNTNGVWHDATNQFRWRVLPLLPGLQRGSGGWIYGTLEGRCQGPFGNDVGKVIQVYPLWRHTRLASTDLQPTWPHKMVDLTNRHTALQLYTCRLLANLERASGGRVEVRVKANQEEQTLLDLLPEAVSTCSMSSSWWHRA